MTVVAETVVDTAIQEHVTKYYAARPDGLWNHVPVTGLMRSGALIAIRRLEDRLFNEDLARVRAGKKPQHAELRKWLLLEAEGLAKTEFGTTEDSKS